MRAMSAAFLAVVACTQGKTPSKVLEVDGCAGRYVPIPPFAQTIHTSLRLESDLMGDRGVLTIEVPEPEWTEFATDEPDCVVDRIRAMGMGPIEGPALSARSALSTVYIDDGRVPFSQWRVSGAILEDDSGSAVDRVLDLVYVPGDPEASTYVESVVGASEALDSGTVWGVDEAGSSGGVE